MIKKYDNFINENFDPEMYRKDMECTWKAHRRFCIDELLKMSDKTLEELELMETQVLSNYYNYLYWNDEGFLDRPGMEEYKEKLKNNN